MISIKLYNILYMILIKLYNILFYFLLINSTRNIKFNNIKKIKKLYQINNLNYDIYNNKYSICLTAEHIFPQSFTKIYPNCKFDMHNICLTESLTNSHRSNYKFIDEEYFFNLKSYEYLYYNNSKNYKNNRLKLFIPCYESRGIISRSIKYMLYNYEKLLLEDVIINEETLEKWDIENPPNEFEYKKNELIKKEQGNHNIFIY